MTLRRILIVAGLLLALVAVNFSVARYERILDNGRTVLLELAPVDPRSLMQGDYMRLRFALADAVLAAHEAVAADGVAPGQYAVVALEPSGRGRYVRLQADATALAPDEVAIRYRLRGGQVVIASDAWFFQEGRAQHFEQARYGELRVAADGTTLLAGMRDANLDRL